MIVTNHLPRLDMVHWDMVHWDMAHWKSVLLQQVPFRAVRGHCAASLHFQASLAATIDELGTKLCGPYLESFLRDYFRDVQECDDRLMTIFLSAAVSFPSHSLHYFEFQGHSISIKASSNYVEAGTTGNFVWEAGVALSEYLVRHPELVRGKRVVELGSGTGLCGIVADALGAASVTLTDLAFVLEMATRKNAPASVQLQSFDWRYPESLDLARFQVVIAADILFDPELIPSLVQVYKHASRLGLTCILAQKIRNPDTFALFCESLGITRIADAPQAELFYYECEDIKILQF